LTFYAVEVMLVCFILIKPWLSIILTALVYCTLYAVLYSIDGAAGINVLNYTVLAIVSVIGLVVRYHSSIGMAETTVQLQRAKDTEIRDKISTLQAMSDIYDNVNLIDFTDNTEMALRDKNHKKRKIDLGPQTHTFMTQGLRERVMPDQLERFIEYTNITTVRSRLVGRKLLSDDFIDVADGWIRAQYIPVDYDENGIALRVIFTTRNVDDEKRREERLLRIAMTDELTRLPNRRSYEEDLMECRIHGPQMDLVLLSADVNGLKKVNDAIGHVAGDELIMGAAECLLLAIGNRGKVYRTGGDEFMAILHTDDPEAVRLDIERRCGKWRGRYSERLSVSVGYAAHADYEGLSMHELEKKADNEMYLSKAKHYEREGIDRRHR
jgi:diguanylate cyclase (GGDEF)-like protein